MKLITLLLAIFTFSQIVSADYTVNYGWENTETILGETYDVIDLIATEPVHSGSQSLYLEENNGKATSEAFVAWIVGLQDGDVVTGNFWRYDTTPGASPSCRIWAHWNNDPTDIYDDDASAGGNLDYGEGLGWDETTWTWTVPTGLGYTGLVIQCRIYSVVGDCVWIDDMTIIAPDHATIRTPAYIPIQRSTWADIKAAF
jgi:hypothetical protein